ncbi:MAG: TldD/PmbA family protein [Treponema sp.]|nr:TldD/PmbA family protein [Treponema sp.]
MLKKESIDRIIDIALEAGDFAEVFCEHNYMSLITANSEKIESSSMGFEAGVGVRIFKGTDSTYVYSSGHTEEKIIKLLKETIVNNKQGKAQKKAFNPQDFGKMQKIDQNPGDVSYKKKLEIINKALSSGKEYSPEIGQMFTRYTDMCQDVIIANSEGVFAEDRRVKTRMMIIAYAQKDGKLSSGWQGPGAMRGFEFYDTLDIPAHSREAARIAVTMLHAEKCKGGQMPVVVANGFGGLIFHEACGHSLEASSVARGASEFTGKIGEQIASPILTLIDDGSIKNAWGSLSVDDEGTPTRKNILIENGILRSYMVDTLNGKRMGAEVTGSARRQNYRFAPTSRMTNTYIASGESSEDEIISATERGLYVKYINGGSVNPATGDFNFASSESYMIENGKIAYPVSGATLIGNGGQVLKNVDMVGNNLKISEGFCFAGSGALFIGAGQPCIRVSKMTVGGVR